MASGLFKRVGNTAVPVSREGRAALAAIKDGTTFVGEFHTARNPEQHALFFSLCTLVAEQTDTTKDGVKEWLLEACKKVDLIFYPDGSMKTRPKSIAWESMEQAEFNEFFQMAIPIIAAVLHAAPADVIKRFNDLLDPNTRAMMGKRLRRKLAMDAPSISPDVPALTDCQGEREVERGVSHGA